MILHIINGANLNLLGKREPEIYGNQSFEDFLAECKSEFETVTIHYFQSNIEGEIVDYIQKHGFTSDGFIINAGGYSHTSIVIADAIKAVTTVAIEVHISNIVAREPYRQHSITGANCLGTICGLGLDGYRLAIIYLINYYNK
jgi:3-dehydroquinate dehydratase II